MVSEYLGLKNLQEWRLCSLAGQLVPLLGSPHGGDFFLPQCHPPTASTVKSLSVFLMTSSQVLAISCQVLLKPCCPQAEHAEVLQPVCTL